MTKPSFAIFAVAGTAIFQSKSPLMFNAAFRDLEMDAAYVPSRGLDCKRSRPAIAREIGIGGLNITAPFKTDIAAHLDGLDPDALIGAVNTDHEEGLVLMGYNTDMAGVPTRSREAASIHG